MGTVEPMECAGIDQICHDQAAPRTSGLARSTKAPALNIAMTSLRALAAITSRIAIRTASVFFVVPRMSFA
jgi:hypothetical protein